MGLGEMPKTGSLGVVGTLGADPWGPSGGFWGHPVLSGTPRSPQDGVPGAGGPLRTGFPGSLCWLMSMRMEMRLR